MKPINKAGVNNCSQKVSEISKNILPGKFKNEHTAINERICSKKPLMRQSRTALPSPAKERSHLIADADKYDDGLERANLIHEGPEDTGMQNHTGTNGVLITDILTLALVIQNDLG